MESHEINESHENFCRFFSPPPPPPLDVFARASRGRCATTGGFGINRVEFFLSRIECNYTHTHTHTHTQNVRTHTVGRSLTNWPPVAMELRNRFFHREKSKRDTRGGAWKKLARAEQQFRGEMLTRYIPNWRLAILREQRAALSIIRSASAGYVWIRRPPLQVHSCNDGVDQLVA